MHLLTREIRFAVNARSDDQQAHAPTNGYGGYPSLTGLGYFFTLAAAVKGALNPVSSYLLNIRQIDARLRLVAIAIIEQHIRHNTFGGGGLVMRRLFDALGPTWDPTMPPTDPPVGAPLRENARPESGAVTDPPQLQQLKLQLSPFQSWTINAGEYPMIRFSQMFEFAAAHRLHNPALSDAQNRQTYGKCNNPNFHGHNYHLQVTVIGTPDNDGSLINTPALERIVNETVIDHFDHKNLNLEVPQFAQRIPTLENIARVIYELLKPRLSLPQARLAEVTVWETPKTWCQYSE